MFPLKQMKADDDFSAYEKFVARRMKKEDYYSAAELQSFIASGQKTAWWMRNQDGAVIAWCALTHRDEDWQEDACSFLGLAVDERYAGSAIALRLIRRVLKEGKDRPMMTYIQPGIETERLMTRFKFTRVGFKQPWNVYRRDPKAP